VSRRIQLGLFAVGAALFALLVRRIGPARIVDNAAAVGWLFLPIVLLYGVAYACNVVAWRLTMGKGARPGFWRTYAITVSGFSLNFVTPVVNAGGEPYRVAALAGWLGRRRAASSVVLHKMLHSLALLLVWLTALLLALGMLPRTAPVVAPIAVALTAVSALAALVLTGHQRGGWRTCSICSIGFRCSTAWRKRSSPSARRWSRWMSRSPSSITPPPGDSGPPSGSSI